LAPGSTIMSWHGDPSGKDSSGVAHDVVMTPYRYTYFDFYQSDPRLEPDITYAPLFLDSVYAFDAGTDAHVLGGEACLWTENVPTPARVEYMLLPRLTALAEALWTPSVRKDYGRFVRSVEAQFKRWDALGIHYARSLYNPGIHPVYDSGSRSVIVRLSAQAPEGDIRYSLGGSFVKYSEPLQIRQSTRLQTAVFRGNRQLGKTNTDSFAVHPGMGALHGGNRQLTDGVFGTVEPYDGRWVSFHDTAVTLTLDLGRVQDVLSVGFNCMEDQVGEIYLPKVIHIRWSEDGQVYRETEDIRNAKVPAALLRHVVHYERVLGGKARYIQLELSNAKQTFLDEIVVR